MYICWLYNGVAFQVMVYLQGPACPERHMMLYRANNSTRFVNFDHGNVVDVITFAWPNLPDVVN